jgi:hypothetical protein
MNATGHLGEKGRWLPLIVLLFLAVVLFLTGWVQHF